MLKDHFGNEVTTNGLGSIETIDHFSNQLLRLGCETGQVLIAAEAFQETFLLQVYAALFYLFAQTEKGKCRANHFLERSRRLLKTKPTERELSIYEAVKLWSQGQLAETLSQLEKHCLKWRRDLVMLKVTEFIYYCKGQEYEGGRFLSLTQNLYQKWKDDPFFLSMHSFALELTGNYSEAEVESNRALDLDNFNSWAHHTLCHVYINRGETEKGIKALESFVPIWNQSARVIQSHNLWHLALM